ncbi:MAG: hypothetical protein HY958_14570 [Bacteroidia bacterium]|nr:hypothetical protein [Bacteroidia bacterium]
MRNIWKPVLLSAVIFYCISCSDNNPTGIKINNKVLKYDKLIVKINNDTLKSNEVLPEKDLTLNINGLSGFKEIAGAVYLGCSLSVKDTEGNTFLNHKDLYSYYDVCGISPKDIHNRFSVSISLSPPMKPGKYYIWKTRIWDKKSNGEINTEMKFKIIEQEKSK